MKVSFNTSVNLTDVEIVQIVGLMLKNDQNVTKATFKAKVKWSLQNEGSNWLEYNIWEGMGCKLPYGKQLAAWAVACQVFKSDITMPERD